MKIILWFSILTLSIYLVPRMFIAYVIPLLYTCDPIRILPGIYKIDGPAAKTKNVYIITDGPLTVIDPGLFYSPKCIEKSVEKLGYQLTDIKYIVLTHYHIDHSGSAGAIRQVSGAKVISSLEDRPFIEGDNRHLYPQAPWVLQICLFAVHILMHDYTCTVDLPVRDGDSLPAVFAAKVMLTPGHTPGSIALLCESQNVLFSGDALQCFDGQLTRAKVIYSSDLSADVASIQRIAELKFDYLLPGDGQPLLSNVAVLVQEYASSLTR